ncbi:MAG: ATP-binding protein, partial [Acidimicrobiia bacterium]
PVAVQAAGVGRYPREIEAAVYFCVLEAVQNAIKHARAKSIAVAVDDDEGHLSFDVRDDGIGFDTTVRRNGLLNMADRLDVVGGALEIVSSRGHGAVVSGRIPISEAALT